ncbi:hypothetical protein NGA_0578302 [Nannochloropsis gaditana CCMP526]|uniref:uncharacterized protein n=1 Tax=Nannochloropsis gaditana (strain CCMP526) TaxID=1093141 RepID=UPI00029F6D04|nr:hypothetical protein NGA_0578302 [Nannochloropsis gaditana CCMP526]EKU22996.1 hypothetical protein NGA_0578302 [Nannochloropsis gaditana CCMP526]|eukprot:XP_005853361.1 hypothetical protein NGA_0578302 [Nannochloropsis gaditana CCMP526]
MSEYSSADSSDKLSPPASARLPPPPTSLRSNTASYVRLDTDLSAKQTDRDEGEEDAAHEEEQEQAVISLDLAVGPVDERLVAALEGDEGGGSREEAKETSGMEEEEEKTERKKGGRSGGRGSRKGWNEA